MKPWTEYNSTMEWPQGNNFTWQYLDDSTWIDCNDPRYWWSYGHRIRFREREVKTVHQMAEDSCNAYLPISHDFPMARAYMDGYKAGWKESKENQEVK